MLNDIVKNFVIRIYYEDTDALGLVYYANYLKFFERARAEYFRSIGFSLGDISRNSDIFFVVRSCKIKFIMPAKFNDNIEVISNIKSLKKKLIQFDQIIKLDNNILVKSLINISCISRSGHATVIPEDIYISLKKMNE